MATSEPIIHEATTENPDPAEFMPIEVTSAFPAGAKSSLNAQEKAQIDKFIEAVPDEDDSLAINYWVDMGDKKVYLEGWIDKCLAGTGYPPMEGGEWDSKIQYMIRNTRRTLPRIQEESERMADPAEVGYGHFTLIEGGFREFEGGTKDWLYGVTWGVYSKPPEAVREVPTPEVERVAKIKYFRQQEAKWRETAGNIAEKERGEAAFASAWTKADEFGRLAAELEVNPLPAVHPLVLDRFEHPAPEEMELGGDIGKMKIKIPPPRGTPVPPKKVGVTVPPEAPLILTMEDYDRDWKPKGWKLLAIGPTSTWRQDWGIWEAIRDIVQNSLDETEAYQWGYDHQGLWIADNGQGVSVADFLLGPPKLKPEYARGRFGEGMKISSLVLVRNGFSVHITTVGKELWIVFLELDLDGVKSYQLNALYKSDGSSRGTKFHLIGYTGPAYEDRFAVNIPEEDILWKGPSLVTKPKQRFNMLYPSHFDVSEGAGSGRIFARDIYLRNINSPYSYNLWSFDLAPDRHVPAKEGDLWLDMGRLWATVSDPDLLEGFLRMVKDPPEIAAEESRKIDMGTWDMGTDPLSRKQYKDIIKENGEAWLKAWNKVNGEDAIIRTSDRFDNIIEHLGYKSISLQYSVRSALSLVIDTDQVIKDASQEKLRETEVVPDDKLDSRQAAHIRLARAIAKEEFPYDPLSGVYGAIIPPASDRVRTAGMYGTSTQAIYISLDMLFRGRNTIDTLIHEMGHHIQWRQTGEAEDLTESHSTAMTNIASSVIRNLSLGKFAEELKDVTW